MNRWLLKSDPEAYSFDDLERDRETVWDGVKNALALQHIRQMAKGDLAFIYHSGGDKCIVGIAEVSRPPYPDPKSTDEKLVVVALKFKKRLPMPVPLAKIKAESSLRDFALVRISRLSVMPVTKEQWDRLLTL